MDLKKKNVGFQQDTSKQGYSPDPFSHSQKGLGSKVGLAWQTKKFFSQIHRYIQPGHTFTFGLHIRYRGFKHQHHC